MSTNKKCRGNAPGMTRCENNPLPGKGYCEKHKGEFECKECGIEVAKDIGEGKEEVRYSYSITIGDKVERDHNQAEKFTLCPNCWNQKKEGYKSLVIMDTWGIDRERNKIEVLWNSYSKGGYGSMWLSNCKVCKKWSDEGNNWNDDYCSVECERNKDKPTHTHTHRERERERTNTGIRTNN